MPLSRELSVSERQKLQQWVAAHGTPQQVVLRCRIVLAAADGQSDVAIAEQLPVNRKTALVWRQRFFEQRLDGLWAIAPGRGRKPSYDIDKIAAIVDATLQTKPEGMTHWSCRTMAKSQRVSKSTINNIWQAHNLKPHRVETFKLSRDPKFLQKMTDVIGLYLNPPEQALVLCVDEKSQIQALAIETVFPQAEVQLCIVHQVRVFAQLCFLETAQGRGGGFTAGLSRQHGRRGRTAARRVRREMG